MKIHEYQAKEILTAYGIPTSKGGVAKTPKEAQILAEQIGGKVVVKAQIHAGGRGVAGGVKLVNSPQEAYDAADALLGKNLVTHQTGASGVPVQNVLVEETAEVSKEYYLAIVVDSDAKTPVIMASEAGGMDIEEIASTSPEKILKVSVDPIVGLQGYQCRTLAYGLNIPADSIRSATSIITNLYNVFQGKDCSLAEINPLAMTIDGQLIALDAKLNLDDDSLFRHPESSSLRDKEQEDPLEVEAIDAGIAYIKLDGDVGCMVNGAGLAMATMDSIYLANAMPANFLDVGGGASEEQVAQAFRLILSDPSVKRILVNIFGGILRCDVAAKGIVEACTGIKQTVPIVVRMLGTNVEEGKEILNASELSVTLVDDMKEAAEAIKQSA
jgi:succinyl-CoA synthetase beta subunit